MKSNQLARRSPLVVFPFVPAVPGCQSPTANRSRQGSSSISSWFTPDVPVHHGSRVKLTVNRTHPAERDGDMRGNDSTCRPWRQRVLAIVLMGTFFCFAATSRAFADLIPGLYNTGVDDFGVPLAPGAVDPHYTLSVSADPGYPFPGPAFVVDPLPGDWLPNTASSQWINPSGEPISHFTGVYEYELEFDLTGLDPSTASISGTWALDDGLSGSIILINGAPVAGTGHAYPGWLVLESFSITSGFVPGINTLTFSTTNEPSVGLNPTGLHVHSLIGVAAPIPQPAALWAGTILLGFLAFRRNRKP